MLLPKDLTTFTIELWFRGSSLVMMVDPIITTDRWDGMTQVTCDIIDSLFCTAVGRVRGSGLHS